MTDVVEKAILARKKEYKEKQGETVTKDDYNSYKEKFSSESMSKPLSFNDYKDIASFYGKRLAKVQTYQLLQKLELTQINIVNKKQQVENKISAKVHGSIYCREPQKQMTRSIGKWKLPQPTDIKEENEWVQIPRIARTVPFGYKQNDEDPDILDPIPTELDLLEKARSHVNQYSYREVANWLSTNTGRYISHVGLRKRLQNERRRKNQAKSLIKWAEYAETAIAKAKALQEERTGSKTNG